MRSVTLRTGLLLLCTFLIQTSVPAAAETQVAGPSILEGDPHAAPGSATKAIGGGDLNANLLPFEVADAVVYINYFTYGLAAFGDHIEYSISQSDINGDGLALTIADWIMLYRVLVGDTVPDAPPPFGALEASAPIHFTYDSTSGVFSLASGAELALVLIRLNGLTEALPLGSLPPGVTLDTTQVGGTTTVRLWPTDFSSMPVLPPGPLFKLETSPGISSLLAADWSGVPSEGSLPTSLRRAVSVSRVTSTATRIRILPT